MTMNYLTLCQAAAVLKIKPYRLTYAITTGLVAEPAMRIANHRVFQEDDMERLTQHFTNRQSALKKPGKEKT